jgi:GAF domain-containing protein
MHNFAVILRINRRSNKMNVSHRTLGVLGLYSSRIDGFDTDNEAVAQILARHAAVALATARHEEALA